MKNLNTILTQALKGSTLFRLIFLCSLIFTTACKEEKKEMTEDQIIDIAKEIHERVITLDTHNDINIKNFTDSINGPQ